MASFKYSDLVNAAQEYERNNPVGWDGTFKMRIDGVSWGTTTTGKDKLVVRLICTAGPRAGQFYKWNLVLNQENPKSIAFFLDRLKKLGVTQELLESEPSENELARAIAVVDRDYLFTFKTGEFNGRATYDVTKFEVA